MLTKQGDHQGEMEFVSIEELVPQEHLVRKIEAAIDFRFIYEKVEGLYCLDNGRPSIDPVVLFKMLMLGYLFGIRSERQLVREIEVNLAYRWFLGFGLRDKIAHHSVFSQNRRRRFKDSTVFQEVFDAIVFLAIERGLVDGHILYTDSTHLKADANKNRFEKQQVEQSTRSYLDELDADVARDREAHGKPPLPPPEREAQSKETRVSTTDPDSGYMFRKGKPEGFFYLDHRTVDDRYNIITDVHITAGNVHDSVPYLDRLARQRERFGFEVKGVGLDAAYFTPAICKGLVEQGIYAAMPYIRPGGAKDGLRKTDFVYDEHFDCYLCPENQVLKYTTTTRDGYREYKSKPERCRACTLLKRCTQSKDACKTICRHIWEHYKEAVSEHRYEELGKAIYARRKETIERSFADAKQLHGHRYARMRGKDRVKEQGLMAAACQNIKKIALIHWRKHKEGAFEPLQGCLKALFRPGNALRRSLSATITPKPPTRRYPIAA